VASREKSLQEIKKCKQDFAYFAKKYLRITNKSGKIIKFKPNKAQAKLYDTILNVNPHAYVLKARQLGISTGVACYFFWKVLFNPNYKVAVVAHTTDAARNIFRIYHQLYHKLPKVLQFETTKANTGELIFKHGGMIKVTSASSSSFRGSTFNALHLSEFAFYEDVDTTLAAILQTATPDACVIYETTANGLNDAHRIWIEENSIEKVFISWTEEEGYVRKEKEKHMPVVVKEYVKTHKLNKEQANWVTNTYFTRTAANWKIFNQEYPITAEVAFITSGDKFFNCTFPHAQIKDGYNRLIQPGKFRVYSIGVDVASGSHEGDYSAWCTLDVTNKENPIVVSTFYARIKPDDFAMLIAQEAKNYDALVVVENNSYGLAVLERLTKTDTQLFRKVLFDKVKNRWTEHLGFNTNIKTRPLLLSRLQQFIEKGKLKPDAETLRCEINSFIFNKHGKPEASSGKHDDMIFATAFALMGIDQIEALVHRVKTQRPSNVREILEWENANRTVYKAEDHDYDSDSLVESMKKRGHQNVYDILHK